MAGSILPLPVMLDEEDRKIYEKLEVPKSIVVRYGYMRMVAELPYDGEAKPGCGSKLVIRTARGIEMGEMLTTTCPNSGCGKSVSRREMLDYIDNSGGKNFPFTTQGKIVRVATVEDVLEQQRLDAGKLAIIKFTRAIVVELDLKMKLVDVELLLGGERMIFHYTSEDWVDFRELVRRLAAEYQTRIEMHQVNARDEARIVADYEKCGQHCCCKQFLKVLKPVSMKSAKIQKATLDPTKISGRCGRLMCCLRYEDETYDDLRKRLPKRMTRWMTDDGPGTVVDTQILTQLALIQLDHDMSTAAYPIENITALSKEDDAKLAEEREARSAREPRRERRDDRRPPREAPGRPPQRGEGNAADGPRGEGQRGDAPRGDAQRNDAQRGDQRPDQRGAASGRTPQRQEPRTPQRGPDQRSQDGGRGGEQRGEQRSERSPQREDSRRDEPRREEPRRPKPGAPLKDDEVASRESSGREDETVEPKNVGPVADDGFDQNSPRDSTLTGSDAEDGDGGDEGDADAGQAQAGSDGQTEGEGGRRRKRRRRRRRRGGGGGGEGGPAAGGGAPPAA